MRSPEGLRPLFEPRSVAVIGASQDASRIGGRTLSYLIKGGFAGRIEEFSEEAMAFVAWVQDALGMGTDKGDFEKAWQSFGAGLTALAELAGRVLG